MKKVTVTFIFLVSLVITGLSQGGETYLFGHPTDPDMTLEHSHPGYNFFANAIANHTEGLSINWDAVIYDIQDVESLADYRKWLKENFPPRVLVECCNKFKYSCSVAIPLSCEHYCPGCFEEKVSSD